MNLLMAVLLMAKRRAFVRRNVKKARPPLGAIAKVKTPQKGDVYILLYGVCSEHWDPNDQTVTALVEQLRGSR